MSFFDVIIKRLLTEAGGRCRRLPWPVSGLEVPIQCARPTVQWSLERWDHLCEKRGFRTPTIAGSMLALVVRAVLTFQHSAVRGPGAWSTFPQGPVSLRLTGTNRASLHTPAQDDRGATKPAGAVEQKKRRSQRRKQLAFVGAAIPCGVS